MEARHRLRTRSHPLVDRGLREVRGVAISLVSAQAGTLSKLAFLAGLSYWFLPIQLIPDRTPYVGYLDNVGFLAAGLIVARLFLLPSFLERVDLPALGLALRRGQPRPRRSCGRRQSAMIVARALSAGRRTRWRVRTASRVAVRDALAPAITPLLLRLSLGRWPDAEEGRRFRKAFQADRHLLPPLLRGIASITAGQVLLIRAAQFASCQARGTAKPGMTESSDADALMHVGNPLVAWDGPPVAFLHVEKTAGTSLMHYLQGWFHPTQIDPDPLRAWAPHMLTRFPPGIAEHVQRYRLVWGHYDLPSLNRLGPERSVLTLLREPRERILSLYRFWRGYPAPANTDSFGIIKARQHSLPEFLCTADPLLRDYIDNVYVRRLTGLYATGHAVDPLDVDAAGALTRALAALDEIDFVGITEQMKESLCVLSTMFGADPAVTEPRLNQTNSFARERFPDVLWRSDDPAVGHALDWLTRLDRVVYDAAKERFATSCGLALSGNTGSGVREGGTGRPRMLTSRASSPSVSPTRTVRHLPGGTRF